MHKPGLKIIFGYLLLTATLCAAVWFIVHSARTASETTEAEQAVAAQRKATNQLAIALIESSTLAENATLLYADNRAVKRYLKGTERVDTAINKLLHLTADTLLKARLDSLHLLTELKSEALFDLIASLRHENKRGDDLRKQIAELRSGKKPVEIGTQVSVPVREHGEEVVIQRRKKGFFHRLGDAFRKAKTDTLQITSSTHEDLTDSTLASVDISDTLANILTDVHRNLTQYEQANSRKLRRQSDELKASGVALSKRIALLMESISLSQQQILAAATQKDSHARRQAAQQMAALAIIATLAALALMLWVWHDMSRAKRYRMELEASKLQTENLMKRREQLLLTISHDIKAPVNTILGYLQLLNPQSTANHNNHQQLAAIDASAHHLLNLVTALLDYHRLEAGQMDLKTECIKPETLFKQNALAFEPLAKQKGLQLLTNIELPANWYILSDAFRLRQVTENLLSNAIKYTQKGTITLEATLKDKMLLFSVTDTGCGLSRYDQERIFEPFTRVKGSEGQEGTGLGLSITLKLIELLGGKLSVQSTVGKGSRFTLAMEARTDNLSANTNSQEPVCPTAIADIAPQQYCQTDCQPATATTSTECTHKTNNKQVALLDDDVLQLQLSEAMLRNVLPQEYNVYPFNTPNELFEWLNNDNRPIMLFTDIEMPALTGYEVLQKVHSMQGLQHLMVVATTSHTLVSANDFCQKGFTDVLFKPFTQNDLRLILNKLLLPNATISTLNGNQPATSLIDEQEQQTTDHNQLVNLAPLLVFADGDAQAEQAILQQFAKDCNTHLSSFKAALAKHNKPTLCQLAHKMLPTHTLIQSPATAALRLLEDRRTETAWTEADGTPCQTIVNTLQQLLVQLEPNDPLPND